MVTREDPPGQGGGTRDIKHQEIAEKLKADPGNWYRILDEATAVTVNRITSGVLAAYRPAGSFEATARKTDAPRRFTIYARYIGKQN